MEWDGERYGPIHNIKKPDGIHYALREKQKRRRLLRSAPFDDALFVVSRVSHWFFVKQ
jgi:hypothetical protein